MPRAALLLHRKGPALPRLATPRSQGPAARSARVHNPEPGRESLWWPGQQLPARRGRRRHRKAREPVGQHQQQPAKPASFSTTRETEPICKPKRKPGRVGASKTQPSTKPACRELSITTGCVIWAERHTDTARGHVWWKRAGQAEAEALGRFENSKPFEWRTISTASTTAAAAVAKQIWEQQ